MSQPSIDRKELLKTVLKNGAFTSADANHPKWYPNGTELVVSVLQAPGASDRGIAKLDVAAFVA